jgi:hypothetical protein
LRKTSTLILDNFIRCTVQGRKIKSVSGSIMLDLDLILLHLID